MSSKGEDESKAAGGADEESGGLLPAIIVGAGILVVAALLLFDFGGGDDGNKESKQSNAAAAQGEGGAAAEGGGAKGGVEARPYDSPSRPSRGRVNPKVQLPNVGMSPQAPPQKEEIPEFANTAEEIAWYEKKLERAIKARDDRKKYVERLPKVQEKIEAGPNAEEGLKAFEGRKKIVEDNYARAVKDVEDIEAKLATLRGS